MINKTFYEFENQKKGDNGTVLIIGGSEIYTGAPYFAGLSALLTGSDLVYIFTTKKAVNPLKILLPEAIVLELSMMKWILDKTDICIYGPGLGRPDEREITIICEIMHYLIKRNIFIIVDGDGIRNAVNIGISEYRNIIYTPNSNERRHIMVLGIGQYMICKGETDEIVTRNKSLRVENKSSNKRCGGQGDILTGIISSLILKWKGEKTEDGILQILKDSSFILRQTSYEAYGKKHESLITRDIINELPLTMRKYFDSI